MMNALQVATALSRVMRTRAVLIEAVRQLHRAADSITTPQDSKS